MKVRLLVIHTFCGIALFYGSNPLHATTTRIFGTAGGITYDENDNASGCCYVTYYPSNTFFTLPGGMFAFNNAQATAYNASFLATMSTSMTGTTSPVSAYAYSGAIFADDVQISAPGLTGQPGFLVLDYSLTGSIEASGSSNAGVVLAVEDLGVQDVAFADYFTSPPVDGGEFVLPITFGDGEVLLIEAIAIGGTFAFPQTGVTSIIPNTEGGDITSSLFSVTSAPTAGTASANLDFLLTGLQALDSQLDPVTTATFDSSSHLQYSPTGITPEPSTFILGGAAIVLMWAHIGIKRAASN